MRRPASPTASHPAPATPAPAKKHLSLESLESRLNLSTLSTLPTPSHAGAAAAAATQEVSRLYRTDPLSLQDAGASAYGSSYTNPQFAQAQRFFNRFKDKMQTPYVAPADPPTPDPIPDPAPTPTPGPAVSIASSTLGNFSRLTITGTSGNDSILVSQSGNTLTITANGNTTTATGPFTELAIYGANGNDAITVQSSVNISTLLYGGAGTNTLTAAASAKSYIVSIGAGADTLTGNGLNTSFWADPADTISASSAETANGNVHRVAAFYQPFTNTPGAADYVSTSLNGQNLRDPSDSGTTTRLTGSLWGTGPAMADVNQGQVGDCYYLATLQSLALDAPNKLREMAVDLGDGTYAVQFKRNGNTSVVRVDADVPVASWGGMLYDRPAAGGALWSTVMEKAYAYFRTAANSFDSLNWGWTGAAFDDLGVATSYLNANTSAPALWSQLTTAIANGKPMAAITNGTITGNAPVIGSHAYTIVNAAIESGVQTITLRNPWGIDGIGNDNNTSDGLVKLSLSQFQSNFSSGSIAV